MGPGRFALPRLGATLVVPVLLVAILLLPSALPPGPGAVPVPADPRGEPANLVSGDAGPRPSSVTVGTTGSTLDLFNSTVAAGNPSWPVNGQNPIGVAWDATDGTVWVTAFGSDIVGAIDPTASMGIRWVPVGTDPWGVAVDNASDTLFVANYAVASVSAVDAKTSTPVATVGVGLGPMDLAYDWRSDSIFVTNYLNSNVSVLNATDDAVETNFQTGLNPSGIAYDAVLDEMFIADFGAGAISVVNASGRSVVGTLSLTGQDPQAVFISPDHSTLFVGDSEGVAIVNLSTGSQTGTVSGAIDASGFAYDPVDGLLYAIGIGPNSAGEVDDIALSNTTLMHRIGLGQFSDPQQGVYVPSTHEVLVSCRNAEGYQASNLTAISSQTNQTAGAIALEHLPLASAHSPLHHALYVYDGGSGTVEELNDTTFALERRAFVGYTPRDLAYDGNGLALDEATDHLYVDEYNYLQHGVTVLDAANLSLVTTVATGALTVAAQAGIAVDLTDGTVYVANYYGSTVTVINGTTNTVQGELAVGSAPGSVLWDPVTDAIYVANYFTSNVTVIDGLTEQVVTNLDVGYDPRGLALDPSSDRVYGASGGPDANLSVIAAATHTLDGTIPLNSSGYPLYAGYDPSAGAIVVDLTNGPRSSGTVAIVNGSAGIAFPPVAVGRGPHALTFDPATGEDVVADYWSGTLSRVTLTQLPGSPLTLTSFAAHPALISLGNFTAFTAVTSGGIGSLTFNYSTLPPGCSSTNASSVSCLPTAIGQFVVGVNVSDSVGERARGLTALQVVNPATLLAITNFSADPSTIDLGGSTTLAVQTRGGSPPFYYVYTGLPTGCQPADEPTLSCTPSHVGEYTVSVEISDLTGRTANASTPVTVQPAPVPPPVIRGFTATPSNVSTNGTVEFAVVVQGGALPLTFVYSGLPTGCPSANKSTFGCTPLAAGTFAPRVTVSDAEGRTASAGTNVTVTAVKDNGTVPSSASPWGPVVEVGGIIGAVALAGAIVVILRRRRGRSPRDGTGVGDETDPYPLEPPDG